MNISILAGWISMAFGVLSGAALGLFFHREQFLGGYASFPRRMLRLGHIAFFGIGFINLLFGLTVERAILDSSWIKAAAWMLAAGAAAMPAACFLAAWKKRMRYLFPIPVLLVSVAIAIMVIHSIEALK